MKIRRFESEESANCAASVMGDKAKGVRVFLDPIRGIHDPRSYAWVVCVEGDKFVRESGEVY